MWKVGYIKHDHIFLSYCQIHYKSIFQHIYIYIYIHIYIYIYLLVFKFSKTWGEISFTLPY